MPPHLHPGDWASSKTHVAKDWGDATTNGYKRPGPIMANGTAEEEPGRVGHG